MRKMIDSLENLRPALLTLMLIAMPSALSGCGGGCREGQGIGALSSGSDMVQTTGTHQAQGSVQNNVLVGGSLASATQENVVAKISVRSNFGPIETYESAK